MKFERTKIQLYQYNARQQSCTFKEKQRKTKMRKYPTLKISKYELNIGN